MLNNRNNRFEPFNRSMDQLHINRKTSASASPRRVEFEHRKRSDSLLCGSHVSVVPLRNNRGHRYSVVSTTTHNPFVDISSQCMKVVASSNRLSKLLSRDDSEKARPAQDRTKSLTHAGPACSNADVLMDLNGPILAEEGKHDEKTKKMSISSERRLSTVFSTTKERLLSLREKRINNSMDKCGRRLGIRNKLYWQRGLLCDLSLFFAMVGITIMLIENELTAVNVISKVYFFFCFSYFFVLCAGCC